MSQSLTRNGLGRDIGGRTSVHLLLLPCYYYDSSALSVLRLLSFVTSQRRALLDLDPNSKSLREEQGRDEDEMGRLALTWDLVPAAHVVEPAVGAGWRSNNLFEAGTGNSEPQISSLLL